MKAAGILIFLCAAVINGLAQAGKATLDQLAAQLHACVPKQGITTIYLKTDKDIYASGEDLWFSAFALDGQFFTLSQADKTLYVELQQKNNDSIVWNEMYPISNGLASGHVYLPETLAEGEYLLKAYSAHSFFSGQSRMYAVAGLQVVKEYQSIRRRKSPAPAPSGAPLQFGVFPEGGELIAGLQNLVAFKAVGPDGDPVEVKGTLVKADKPICRFKTTHAGMGRFLFTPEKQAVYHIRLDEYPDSTFPVPPAQDNGILLQLEKQEKDSIAFKLLSNQPGKTTVYLRLQVRGMTQAVASATLADSVTVKIPLADVPSGIAEATLFDDQLRPLAERLVFLRPEQRLNVSMQEMKQQYQPREKVTLKIKTTNAEGKPVPAVLSLTVHDRLFGNPRNGRDILNYYLLSTQLRGRIYDPTYYFDDTHTNRLEALDLLLLSQGWRQYTWNETLLKENSRTYLLSDSLPLQITAMKKSGKEKYTASLMVFNYNRQVMSVVMPDSNGLYYLSPENLATAPRFFIQYFSEKDHKIQVFNPFKTINEAELAHHPVYLTAERSAPPQHAAMDTGFLQYGQRLREVTVSGKGTGFSDKYLGVLDSIAKYEGVADYVGACGMLNCPVCMHGTKPVEGKTYSELKPERKGQIPPHPFRFGPNDVQKVVYSYPKYSEEELLKKFRLTVTKGYYQSRKFYEPEFDSVDYAGTDIRNVLLWKPVIVTDQSGEATVSFHCSDIRGVFQGKVEGVNEVGNLGVGKFQFSVNSSNK